MTSAATTVLPRPAPRRVLAFGAWLKNTACRLDGNTVTWSPLHGDLAEPVQCQALEASVAQLVAAGPVDVIAHDLHPDFFSSRLAAAWADRLGVPAVAVQHHHAHIAALQAEHGVSTPVVGLALDGVGLGTDGTAWGGELLWVDAARWQRLGHLWPLRLPGGDAAAREPWRMAAASLQALDRIDDIDTRLSPAHGATATRLVASLLSKGLHSPWTSSAGRWFDAAAGALGLGARQAFEAQAAIQLEHDATGWLASGERDVHPVPVPVGPEGRLDLRPLMQALWQRVDPRGGPVDPSVRSEAAAVFHVSLAHGLAQWALQALQRHDAHTLALGGGCFFNRLLVRELSVALERLAPAAGLPTPRVLQARAVSCGDAGLALGQAWVAAHEPITPSGVV